LVGVAPCWDSRSTMPGSARTAAISWARPAYRSAWEPFAEHLTGAPIEAGHFLAEEAPEPTGAALARFLRD
jgi:hypothetical protein